MREKRDSGANLILAGTGGVSLVALVFAKAAGATTIITSSSDEKLALVKSKYGVDHTINYKKHPAWSSEVQRLTGGKGADHIIEIGGTGTMQQSLDSVARGGIISVIGFLTTASQELMPDVTMASLFRGCIIRGVQSGSKQQLEEAIRCMHNCKLQMPVDKTFGFKPDEVLAALKYVESGRQIGKVCINVD